MHLLLNSPSINCCFIGLLAVDRGRAAPDTPDVEIEIFLLIHHSHRCPRNVIAHVDLQVDEKLAIFLAFNLLTCSKEKSMQLGLISRKYAIQLAMEFWRIFFDMLVAKIKKTGIQLWSENFEKSNGRKTNEFYKLIKLYNGWMIIRK